MGAATGGGTVADATRLSTDEYHVLTGTIRETVDRVVPENATVLVVSRGDEQLLRLGPRRAHHFPQDEAGRYAGYHPADGEAAIAMLEQLRSRGADFLVLPATAFWWLDYYARFKQHIEQHYEVIASGEDCWIARLGKAPVQAVERPSMELTSSSLGETIAEIVSGLLPEGARVVVLSLGSDDVGAAAGFESWQIARGGGDDNSTAVENLAALESDGIRFVVLPETLFVWMEDHPSVRARLARRYRLVMRQEHFCEIYELRPQPPAVPEEKDQDGDGETSERPRSLIQSLKAAIFRTHPG